MGFYTDVKLDMKVRPEACVEIEPLLRFMFCENHPLFQNGSEVPDDVVKKPDHALFATERWHIMLCCSANYTDAEHTLQPTEQGLKVQSVSSFKNYGGEALLFADWIRPHLVPQDAPFMQTRDENEWEQRFFTDGRAEKRLDDYCYEDRELKEWRPIRDE